MLYDMATGGPMKQAVVLATISGVGVVLLSLYGVAVNGMAIVAGLTVTTGLVSIIAAIGAKHDKG